MRTSRVAVFHGTGRPFTLETVAGTGILTPEEALEPTTVFAELKRRGLVIHERIEAA